MRRLLFLTPFLALGCTDDRSTEPTADSDSIEIDTEQPVTSPTRAAITLHADPNSPTNGIVNASPQNWLRLKNFVAAADAHGHKVTILLHSDWVPLIENAPDGWSSLVEWAEAGHQFGYHHHTCGHTHPDGYRDLTHPCDTEADRGSVRDSFLTVRGVETELINRGVSADAAEVSLAAQGPNDQNRFRSQEWQPEATLATGTANDNNDGHTGHSFITRARCTNEYGNIYDGETVVYTVPELGHAQIDVGNFTTTQSSNNLGTLKSELQQVLHGDHVDAPVHISLVFHPREYATTPRATDRDEYTTDQAYIDAILTHLATEEIEVVTVGQILQEDAPCATP